uniref:Uncharacterized protein n=1 Tax=Helianthus annuus TaxID=4232 RepID=A0A251U2Y3_HELAN
MRIAALRRSSDLVKGVRLVSLLLFFVFWTFCRDFGMGGWYQTVFMCYVFVCYDAWLWLDDAVLASRNHCFHSDLFDEKVPCVVDTLSMEILSVYT